MSDPKNPLCSSFSGKKNSILQMKDADELGTQIRVKSKNWLGFQAQGNTKENLFNLFNFFDEVNLVHLKESNLDIGV